MASILLDPDSITAKADSRDRGDRLRKLREVCESQKTISTRRLSGYLNELAASDCQDGLQLKELADFVRRTKG